MTAQAPPRAWTDAYICHRQAYLERVVVDREVAGAFDRRGELPAGYGRGLDERCVEYPWALARLARGGRRVLDAGSALNHPWLLAHPALAGRELHVMTLAPEPYCAWDKGVSYVFGDLRDTPLRDGWYDQVVSVSTLEHVGFDNAHYGGDGSPTGGDPLAFLDAVAELRRVVRPGGRCLVTVPFGVREDLGIAQQFDESLLARLVDGFAPSRFEAEFYRLDRDGWRRSTMDGCREARYVRWAIDFFVNPAGFDLDKAPREPDHAAAARAVACLNLVK